jgi:hypothetical protein
MATNGIVVYLRDGAIARQHGAHDVDVLLATTAECDSSGDNNGAIPLDIPTDIERPIDD